VNYDNSLVVTITVAYYLWAPSSSGHLFTCGAISRPPHFPISHFVYNFRTILHRCSLKSCKCLYVMLLAQYFHSPVVSAQLRQFLRPLLPLHYIDCRIRSDILLDNFLWFYGPGQNRTFRSGRFGYGTFRSDYEILQKSYINAMSSRLIQSALPSSSYCRLNKSRGVTLKAYSLHDSQ